VEDFLLPPGFQRQFIQQTKTLHSARLFNSSYFIGQILASAIALGTTDIPTDWAWRIPSLLQICPSLLQICTVL
jgi:hypothetical protein